MRLIVDMNLSPAWVDFLAASGFEATHWSQIGAPTAPDVEIMAYARSVDAVVLTHDLDFGAILAATGGRGPSVIQIRADDIRPEAIGDAVVQALRQTEPELTAGALLTIEPSRARVRILPLATERT